MAPTWSSLGDAYKENEDVNIAHVDCTQSKDICTGEGIKGYPTLKLYFNGETYKKYSGIIDEWFRFDLECVCFRKEKFWWIEEVCRWSCYWSVYGNYFVNCFIWNVININVIDAFIDKLIIDKFYWLK